MEYEILRPENYFEYEDFVKNHKYSEITQSIKWHDTKKNWAHEVAAVKKDGRITAGASILIRKIPVLGVSMMYCPRGPICDDPHDAEVIKKLKEAVDLLAKKHRAYIFKIDPDIPADDKEYHELMTSLGFRNFKDPTGFKTIQTRFNYRLFINGRSEEELLAGITQKTRYNIRLAIKKGVTARAVGKEYLPEFMRIMRITGERDGFNIRPQSYFENMMDSLGENVRLYMAFYQDKAVSGAVTTNYGGKTYYIYGASDNAHRNVMPNYLIQWEMIKWALEENCTVYDFLGISGDFNEGDPLYGLYRFKRGFNGEVAELAGEYDYIYKPFINKLINLARAFLAGRK